MNSASRKRAASVCPVREENFLAETSELLGLERRKWAEGFSCVAGIDEAGRGPLAGPVVAAAVVLPRGVRLPAVFDSKQLSAAQRAHLRAELLQMSGIRYGIAEVSAEEIDRINILNATHLAMRLAVEQLGGGVDFLLIDGLPVKGMTLPFEAVVKGDARSASIAAASILAKEHRDDLMRAYDREYPGYGFAGHKGYGTRAHLEALARLGATPIHRLSFAPVRRVVEPPDTEQMEWNFERGEVK